MAHRAFMDNVRDLAAVLKAYVDIDRWRDPEFYDIWWWADLANYWWALNAYICDLWRLLGENER